MPECGDVLEGLVGARTCRRDVVVVVLVVLTTASELLIAADVSFAALGMLTQLLHLLIQGVAGPEGVVQR